MFVRKIFARVEFDCGIIGAMEKHVAVSAFEEHGWEGVIALLDELPTAESIKSLNQLLIHFRWELKDLDGIVKATEMAEKVAGDSADPEVLGALKAVCFNRAAFFWRGWGDEDVRVSKAMELDATPYAEKNLELARRLAKLGVPLGRAEWLVGAFDWANGDPVTASERFERAAELTAEGDDPLEPKMCLAYAKVAVGEDATELLAELDAAENGEFYASQVRSALKVYGSS